MQQLTLNDLKKQVDKLVASGHGNDTIVLSDDDEGNGVHAAWFGIEQCDSYYSNDLAWRTHNADPSTTLLIA